MFYANALMILDFFVRITFPLSDIVFDVFGNAVHFGRIADNVVIESGLPSEGNGIFASKCCC